MRRKFGTIFIILGISILAYVLGEQLYSYTLEKRILSQTEEVSKSLQKGIQKSSEPASLQEQNQQLELNISKIDLKVRVVEGTTKEKLRVAVGHLEGSGGLGEKGGNFVILGHRSSITGRFFNRLDELSIGDTIVLQTSTMQLTYKVITKKIINPSQLEVLEPIPDKSIVTLITCHPKYSNKQRLVIVTEKEDG